jgi:hypothetical protein
MVFMETKKLGWRPFKEYWAFFAWHLSRFLIFFTGIL